MNKVNNWFYVTLTTPHGHGVTTQSVKEKTQKFSFLHVIRRYTNLSQTKRKQYAGVKTVSLHARLDKSA